MANMIIEWTPDSRTRFLYNVSTLVMPVIKTAVDAAMLRYDVVADAGYGMQLDYAAQMMWKAQGLLVVALGNPHNNEDVTQLFNTLIGIGVKLNNVKGLTGVSCNVILQEDGEAEVELGMVGSEAI